jgi:hypothetical protein
MYTDLNHLFATDGYVNNMRNNYPFGEVSSPTYTSSNGSKLGNNSYSIDYSGVVFEPINEYKGDFARAYFYMATRYKDDIPSWVSLYGATTEVDVVFDATGNFQPWYLNMLLDWVALDPVSQKEIDRNDAVYNAQGNANPYINHPEWINEVFATIIAEPQNYSTYLTLNTKNTTSITLSWTDATGNPLPLAYLIKASSTGFPAITLPVDGTPETDATLVKNINMGVQTVQFTGLTENTTYYFEIFPYTNSRTAIDYKTDGTPPQISITTNAAVVVASGCAGDLFFSEYIEGSSYNKYIEIYNATGNEVDLSDYRMELFANGAASATNTYSLSGTLTDNSTIVYGRTLATAYTGAYTAITFLDFNGDDAIALYKISTASYVDIFGSIGYDPGASWGTGLTVDHTLVRKWYVKNGVTTNPTVDFPTVKTEWTAYNIDDVSHLGSHTINCSISKDLYISEYIEGSSNNKALEITNSTDVDIDLADYRIWTVTNSGTWFENSMSLSGTLVKDESYVIANSSANAAILSTADLTTSATVMTFNGNDAVGLAHNLSAGYTLVDAIGTDGADPGTGWSVAGVSNATNDHTLVRKPNFINGNTYWASSAGTSIENSEWFVLPTDYSTDLGAQTKTFKWIGASSDWATASNWDVNKVPGVTANVVIQSGYADALISSNTYIYDATILPNGALTIDNAAQLFVYDSLKLKSDATGNASLIESGNLTINKGNSEELLLSDFGKSMAWHYFSSPVNTWPTTGFNSTYLYRSNEATAWDMDNLSSPLAWKLNDLGQFQDMEGYAYESKDTTLIFSGQFNKGTYSANLSYTDFAALDAKNEGWHLIGNPYPSAIDWDAAIGWTKTNIDLSIYLWDDNLGLYKYYNSLGALGVNSANNFIPPMQAFYVKVNDVGGGTLAMNDDVRTHHAQAFYKNTKASNYFRLKLSNQEQKSDECIVLFDDFTDFSDINTYKLFTLDSETPQIALQDDATSYAIFADTSLLNQAISISLFIPDAGEYKISLSENESSLKNSVLLFDAYTNSSIDLSAAEYSFKAETKGMLNNRFSLHSQTFINSVKEINAYYANESVFVNGLAEGKKNEIRLFDISGRLISYHQLKTGSGRFDFNQPKGIYFIQISSESLVKTIKFVSK